MRKGFLVFLFIFLLLCNYEAIGFETSVVGSALVQGSSSYYGSPRNSSASILPDSLQNVLTFNGSSAREETISLPPEADYYSTLSTRKGETASINENGEGKLDRLLGNLTFLIQKNYIRNNKIRLIVQLCNRHRVNADNSVAIADTDYESLKKYCAQINASVENYDSILQFVTIEMPYRYIFDLARVEQVDHVFLDREFKVCLNESVAIIKPYTEWKAVEQGLGRQINGSGIRVAVLDTGIDESHPDLSGKIVLEKVFTSESSPTDGFGHGTHCASIIAGTGKASNGTFVGVAPGVLLLNGKVLTDQGWGQEDWIISGVEWAVNNFARVISMSLGSDVWNNGTDPLSLALDWASDKGVVCAVAAGNRGQNGMFTVGAPATSRKAIVVGATYKNDSVTYFSSQGLTADWRIKPDVCAPGKDIIAARAKGTSMGIPINSYYTKASGTSMATPHVAGAAALILQVHPDWNPLMVKAALMGTAEVLNNTPLWEQGSGRIDVAKAATTKLLVIQPSASFGFLKPDAPMNLNLTIMNLSPGDLTAIYSVAVKLKGQAVQNCASLSFQRAYIFPYSNSTLRMYVGPAQSSNVGWWEGRLNITFCVGFWGGQLNTTDAQCITMPFVAGSFGVLHLRMIDEDGALLTSYFIFSTYPQREFVRVELYSPDSSDPLEVFIGPGTYSVVALFPSVMKLIGGGYADDNYRSAMIEKIIPVSIGVITSIDFSLADAKKSIIVTKDKNGQYLLIHSFKEAISAGPWYNKTSGTTCWNWTFETGWTSSEDTDGNRESRLWPLYSLFNQPWKPMIFYHDFDDNGNLSRTIAYYGSNDVFSEVYLLVWKYWNTGIPDLIRQSEADLVRYNIYYDFPETFPVHLQTGCYIDFTSNLPNPYAITHTKHIIPAGVNATYYLTPEIASYRGVYFIEYSWWAGSMWCISPGQTWTIRTPARNQSGYIHLGNYKFGPYTPGMTVKTICTRSNCTIMLTGDIWSNLHWPEPWDVFWGDDCGQDLLGAPPTFWPQCYWLYVDGLGVANGSLSYTNGLNLVDGMAYYTNPWNNLSRSWSVSGSRASLVMELPNMVSPETSSYTICFDLTRNLTMVPPFNMSKMPMSYTAGEEILFDPQFSRSVVNATLSYSFDSGRTWIPSPRLSGDFGISCESKKQLELEINATDTQGSTYSFRSKSASYCRDVKLMLLKLDANQLVVKATDAEGQIVNQNCSLYDYALQSISNGNVSYSQVTTNGLFVIANPKADNISISFLGIGVYGKSTLTLHKPRGDVNYDGEVDVLDLICIASALGLHPGEQRWNPSADVVKDGEIDVLDLIACVNDMGRTWTWSTA